jgi:DNA-binding LacI/PurR family transcriptional regulator
MNPTAHSPLAEAPAALRAPTSLIVQAVRWLRQALADQVWEEHLPGERELCAQVGVSRPTLRLALEQIERDGLIEVAHGRRRRIIAHASKVEPAAPGKKRICMLLPELGPVRLPFQSGIYEAMRQRLDQAGLRIETHVSAACGSTHPERALEKLVAQNPADAWLLVHTSPRTHHWFARHRIPCVVSGSCEAATALPSVDVDHGAACRHAVGVLVRAGRRQIALLTPRGSRPGDVESELGFQSAITAHGGGLRSAILRHDDSVTGLIRTMDAAFLRRNSADAMIVARPSYALLALTYLQKKGTRVPKDVALIARTDDPMLDFATPRISCYRADAEVFGRQLADALLTVVAGGFGWQHTSRQLPIFMRGETVDERCCD